MKFVEKLRDKTYRSKLRNCILAGVATAIFILVLVDVQYYLPKLAAAEEARETSNPNATTHYRTGRVTMTVQEAYGVETKIVPGAKRQWEKKCCTPGCHFCKEVDCSGEQCSFPFTTCCANGIAQEDEVSAPAPASTSTST